MEPSYIALHASGELARRAGAAIGLLSPCTLCPRRCRADRTVDQAGFCRTGRRALVASYDLHFGEEAPLVGPNESGSGGSGTVFFAGCNLGCAFCQNHDISHHVSGSTPMAPNQLAWIMLQLQERGARNINLVTPSHVVPQILEALVLAAEGGLRLPLVYNSSAYDGPEALRLLDGVVDIHMPDAKFWDPDVAARCCAAPDYPEAARRTIKTMHAQVGDLTLDDRADNRGIAVRGLLVRHLVMPDGLAGTEEWMEFLAREVSPDTYLNIMDQYRPCGDLGNLPELQRPVTRAEYQAALDAAARHGLTRLDDRMARGLFRLLRGL